MGRRAPPGPDRGHHGLRLRPPGPRRRDLAGAPGAPAVGVGQSLSGLLLPSRGEIWVNADEARRWPPRRRFTIGHEVGHWVLHRQPGQQALFCRHTSIHEPEHPPAEPPRDIEEEASAFAAALLMPRWLFVREHARCDGDVETLCETFGTSRAATARRVAALFGG
ncbi:ImmA/IrrE family metallo-endopeptidase [Paraconexibacter antarcticus]|uniref:ImmA/IrrE family metallo-endopeptidase n=1 Tax=Paraconexibacter antarcticus TaxID=2949664 RepID=A0ABY5DX26_9ACTN|nr:ImmA/IrrE family metallo-endopeptidase [Paraconexibacter antarcticus]UTI65205.1 ImmA/IrrE family metallo-endopeptidase [Paraconexibacter antarcticus]